MITPTRSLLGPGSTSLIGAVIVAGGALSFSCFQHLKIKRLARKVHDLIKEQKNVTKRISSRSTSTVEVEVDQPTTSMTSQGRGRSNSDQQKKKQAGNHHRHNRHNRHPLPNQHFTLTEIGKIASPFPLRAGTPRQGLLAPNVRSILTLHSYIPPETCHDLQQYSHVWVIFQFHLNPINKAKQQAQQQTQQQYRFKGSKIKPPRAPTGKKVGVFATRSPHRPNSIGLSLAMIESVETCNKRTIVKLLGLDLVHGTPVYDIKPYIPSDSITIIDTPTHTTPPLSSLITPSWVSNDEDLLSFVIWTKDALHCIQQEQQSGLLTPLYPPLLSSIATAEVAEATTTSIAQNNQVCCAISEIIAQDPRAQYDGREQNGTFEITFCTLRIRFKVVVNVNINDNINDNVNMIINPDKNTSNGTADNNMEQYTNNHDYFIHEINPSHNNNNNNNKINNNFHPIQDQQEVIQNYAIIESIIQDPGDATAHKGSYQYNLAIRRQGEKDAQIKGIKQKLHWLHSLQDGEADDKEQEEKLLMLKGGKVWDLKSKTIIHNNIK